MTIRSETEEKKILRLIIAASEEFLQSSAIKLNYQKISDDILYISGAKYASFDIYDGSGSTSTTKSLSASESVIKKIYNLLGFKLLGKEWDFDPVLRDKIKSSAITRFSTLADLTGSVLPKSIVSLMEKVIDIGEVVFVKILNETKMVGSFTLLMHKNTGLKNDDFVELYAQQLGHILARKHTEEMLRAENKRLANITEGTNVGTWEWNVQTGIITFDVLSAGFLGYTLEELSPIRIEQWEKFVHPGDLEEANKQLSKVFAREKNYFDVENRLKHKNGSWIWEHDRGKVTSWTPDGKPLIMNGMYIDISERKKAEEKLQNATILLNASIESLKDMIIFAIDKTYNYLFFNFVHKNTMKLIYGKEIEIGMSMLDYLILEEDKINTQTNFNRALNGESHSTIQEYGDKKRSFYETFYNPIVNENHEIIGATAFARDITERRQAEEALRLASLYSRNLIETSLDPLVTISPEGKITDVNTATEKVTGLNRQELLGKDFVDFFTEPETARAGYLKAFEQGQVINYPLAIRHTSGALTDVLYNASIYRNEQGEVLGVFAGARDITERKQAEAQIIYLSFHDYLTGLYNRRFFEEELKRLDTERQLPLSFIMGDLNGLKIINDVFGHAEGDKLLKETAKILKKACRSDDILARWGGDEFVILLPKTSISDSEEIIERIKHECRKTNSRKIPISLSLGVTIKETADQEIHTILAEAESNMYKNKIAHKESQTGSIIFALDLALYEKSSETREHAERIHELAIKLGKSFGFTSNQLNEISLLASLHDIGKVAITDKILLKKGKLTEKEWILIKRHPEIGFSIAQSSPQIAHIAKFILSCHENWDGSGYPLGLKGKSIPIASRIILIADAYVVMTSGRIYKAAMNKDDAITELKRCAGTQFDPVLAARFIEIIAD